MSLIKLILGKNSARLEIHLIGAEEESSAGFGKAFFSVSFNLVYGLSRMFGSEGAKGVKPFPMLRKSQRNNGNAVNSGIKSAEIFHAALQCRSIVYTGAANDLAVHLNSRLREALHNVHDLPRPFAAEHFNSQLGVGGMDGDIHWRNMQVDYSLYFSLRKIGKGDIAAHKKAQSGIIILEIYAFSHSRGILVNEAKNAAVCAASGSIHQIGGKLQTQILSLGFSHTELFCLALGGEYLQRETVVIAVILIVKHVLYGMVIYAYKSISNLHLSIEGACVFNFADHISLCHNLLPLIIRRLCRRFSFR